MALSIYQKRNLEELQQKAYTLYRQGLTLREIGKVLDRSHEWVRLAIKKIEEEKLSTV